MRNLANLTTIRLLILSRPTPRLLTVSVVLCLSIFTSGPALGQSLTFGGNAQHTSSYGPPAQNLNVLKWSTSIDFNNSGAFAHYGSPLVTESNTVLVPVRTATDGFRVDAFNAVTASPKYTVATDYILPAHNWIPTYNPCIATGTFGTRMYYAGAGGTIWHIDNVDSNTPGAPVREVFYTSLATYNANAAAYNGTVFVNTPITADSAGNIYFGFRVQGIAPEPLNTSQSGFARIDSNGNGIYVLAGSAANDTLIDLDSHNLAPALSNDESTVYVAVKSSTDPNHCFLLGLNSTTLATRQSVFLRDPRNGSGARIPDDGTSSPTVGPDGDVYFGVLVTPSNGSRGFLLHFSGDLSIEKLPGGFGWDYTAAVVPAGSVPSYSGTSSYLLFSKYNDYPFGDGSGVNKVALLDPNDTQIDHHSSALGLVEMREVLSVIGPTPDFNSPGVPKAVREWCINAPAVNPATNSVFFDSEDGHLYRWNLLTNSLDQAVALTQGLGQPYVPTVMGPDGTVYTLNGGNFFALGSRPGVDVTISSSSPDLRGTVVGNAVTFTATVSGSLPAPTGSVTFEDRTYNGFTSLTTTLASNVPLNGSGQAAITTSSLAAGGSNLGNHWITARYSGDANHPASSVTMVQKVHANASTTALTSSLSPAAFGQSVSFTAVVSPVPSGAGVPTGMVTFQDGTTVIGQVPLDSNGAASITRSNLNGASHTIKAIYVSDTQFAASSSDIVQVVQPASNQTIQFVNGSFNAPESMGSATIGVSRSGDTSSPASVDYSTSDTALANPCNMNGVASSRCDYLATLGTLRFATGETTKTISIPIIDDAYAEGNESFTITLSNAIGAILGTPATATITIADNDGVNGTNPIDMAGFFVRQHYVDFLNREPDPDGLAFWTNQIIQCGSDPQCIEIKRINVSAAFFLSIEFQESGYLIYRMHKSAFGNLPAAPVPVRLNEFLGGTQQIGQGVQVGIGSWQTRLESNTRTFALEFVQRPEFLAAFPASQAADQFVTLLNTNAGGVLSVTEKANLVGVLGTTPSDIAKRAWVLRSIAEDPDLKSAEFNKAFVLMQYFGYLRRDPNVTPNTDFSGYNFWLDKLNQFNGNFVQADMVKAFLVSGEFRQRFGP